MFGFAADAAAIDVVQLSGELHRDGGATLPAFAEESGVCAADQRNRIHAGVGVIPAIFVARDGLSEFGGDGFERRPEAELFVACGGEAQERGVFGV